MNVSLRKLLVLPSLALGFACAHEVGTTMNARVMTRAQGTSVIQPVNGASVALACPQGSTQELGKTDATGDLHADYATAMPMDCSFVVSQPGLRSYTVRVSDVCTELASGGCQTADLRTVLAPATTGSAGGVR
jgi:hypothetical protein